MAQKRGPGNETGLGAFLYGWKVALSEGSCIETGASHGLNFPLVPKEVAPGLNYSHLCSLGPNRKR